MLLSLAAGKTAGCNKTVCGSISSQHSVVAGSSRFGIGRIELMRFNKLIIKYLGIIEGVEHHVLRGGRVSSFQCPEYFCAIDQAAAPFRQAA